MRAGTTWRPGPGPRSEYRDGGKVVDYLTRLFKNVPVLDTGARGSTTTFVERGIGDVLLAWENEALLTLAEADTRDKFEIVVPSLSIKAEPPVAWVDKNVDKHGTRKQAEAYLRYLYTPEGQRLAAKHGYRPAEPDKVPAAELARFPAGEAGDHRQRVRRLEEGAGGALRRWRVLRQDLSAEVTSSRITACCHAVIPPSPSSRRTPGSSRL